MVINVEVKFLGIFRRVFGRNKVLVKLEKHPTVRKTIEKLTEAFPPESKRTLVDQELEDPRPNALILVNGQEISVLKGLDTEIEDGDEIVLVPVSHGG
jgi:molybdopterin synthase sulfur carrier subunit